MFTVLTAATGTALTTLTRARAIAGFPSGDDEAATELIRQASAAIVDHCNRPFALETVRESFEYNEAAGGGPILARDPVVEVLSVTSNGDLLAANEYRIDPRSGRLQRLDADGRALPWWGGPLVIEYRAGYVLPKDDDSAPASTLPASVERAAIMLLTSYLSVRGRDPLIKSDSVEGVGSTSWWVPGESDRFISPETQQLLSKYVRFFP